MKMSMKRRMKYLLMFSFLKLKKYDLRNGIIICSEPRSGSSWLMELLNNIPKTIVNWEPFHQSKGLVPNNWSWGRRPHIPENEKSNMSRKLIKRILSLSIYNHWTLSYTNYKVVFRATIVLTKFVRANALLPWILNNFNLNRRPILLLRNPLDSCYSSINAFNSEYDVAIPKCINNQRYKDNYEYLKTLKDPVLIKIAFWCIDSQIIFNNDSVFSKLIVVFYEDMVLSPKEEFLRIIKELGLDIQLQDFIDKIDFNKQSRSPKGTLKEDPYTQLSKNYEKIDKDFENQVQSVYDHFGLKLYNAYSAYPNKEYINLISADNE